MKEIVGVSERYQQYITNLKEEGYHILGYCHKSKTTWGNANTVGSLQAMIAGLKSRSLVEYVYVSASCNAKAPINRRDLKKNTLMNELADVTGDAQGIQYHIKYYIQFCI